VGIRRLEQNHHTGTHLRVSKPDRPIIFVHSCHPASTNGYAMAKKHVYDNYLPLPLPQHTAAPTYTFSRATAIIQFPHWQPPNPTPTPSPNLLRLWNFLVLSRTITSYCYSYPILFSLGFIYLPTHTHKHTHAQAAVSYNPTVTQLNLAMDDSDACPNLLCSSSSRQRRAPTATSKMPPQPPRVGIQNRIVRAWSSGLRGRGRVRLRIAWTSD